MNGKKGMYLGAAFLGALLVGGLNQEALARAIGGLYGNRLHVETEPRNATPNVTLGDDDAFIAGTLEVDGASRFDALASHYAGVAVSTALVGATAFVLDGAYTSTQIAAKTPSAAGQLIFSTTLGEVCVSTGATLMGYARVKDAATCQ